MQSKIGPLSLLLFLGFVHVRTEDVSSEERSDGVPIIRQINKINDDGTYTYGYEAADGTFKIETRDVLGNVKGMFGFVDEAGELKRVSYTANNETGFKNSVTHRPIAHTTGSSTEIGKRPVLLLKNMPLVSTKGPVIQHIPKKTQRELDDEYNARRFTTNKNNSDDSDPTNPLRKILVSKRPIEEKEVKGKGGNSLRRQLNRALELRGESAHVYSGADGRLSSPTNLPSHLSALMSELRPIQAIRSVPGPPETIPYQSVESDPDVSDAPTTELPYGSRKYIHATGPPGYISPRYRARPIPIEDGQYAQEVPVPYRPTPHVPVPPITPPVNVPYNPNYPTQGYYDQNHLMAPATLRDELMAIIYNYLQVRLGPLSQYPAPRYPYPQILPYQSPYINPIHSFSPYLSSPQVYSPYQNGIYPTSGPYQNPNVQFSPRQEVRGIPPRRAQSARSTVDDDTDLLQMLLTSPTRIPVSQLKYATTTEKQYSQSTQPVRNVQILTDSTASRPVTTESPE